MKVTYKCIKIDSHTFSPQTYFQPNIQSLQEIVIRNDFFATKNMLLAMIKISRQHLIVDANSKFFANVTALETNIGYYTIIHYLNSFVQFNLTIQVGS